MAGPALADRIRNPTAVFSGLDKITGRIIKFEVAIDETVQFGALQITPKVCWSRPPTEAPHTTGFVQVDEVTLTNEYRRVFGGWMFASSPGLHGVDHPVYDVWLTDCKGGTEIIVETREAPPADDAPPPTRQPASATSPSPFDDGIRPGAASRPPAQAPTRRYFPTDRGSAPPDPAR